MKKKQSRSAYERMMEEAEKDIVAGRYHTSEEVMQRLKERIKKLPKKDPKDNIIDNPPKWEKNEKDLPQEYIAMVNEVIREDAREEAIEIIRLANDTVRETFKEHYENDKHNVFCLHLDSTKYILHRNGIMKHGKGDHFGNPWLDIETEE